jgi:hypothetical protein
VQAAHHAHLAAGLLPRAFGMRNKWQAMLPLWAPLTPLAPLRRVAKRRISTIERLYKLARILK